MTRKEFHRRLDEMSVEAIATIESMFSMGYGGHSIALETPYTTKQVNAVAKKYYDGWAY
jgi:hypothetical protein